MLLAAFILIFLPFFFFLAGPSWGLALYRLTFDLSCALVWLISVTGTGWILWRLLFDAQSRQIPRPTLVLVTCSALGIGIISLLLLGLGLAGWLNRITAFAMMMPSLAAAGIFVFQNRHQFDPAQWLRTPVTWQWLWVLVAPLAAVVTLAAFFPPGMLWGDEPNGYDVVEYHLQLPREWFEAGRITALHHNVFSYFPFNVEMHYLLAMHLHGDPWRAMYLTQLMHLTMCALTILAIYALAENSRAGTVAAVLAAAVPWTGLLAPIAYNEGGTLLFGTLAIGWTFESKTLRHTALAGAMAGLAAGAKWSIAPLLIAGIPLAIFVAAPLSFRKKITCCVVHIFAALLVLSPWLIRNMIWAHNPVFPEAMHLLGKAHFTDVQVTRWEQAYWPELKYRSATGRLHALWDQVLADPRYGYALWPIAAGALLLGRKNRDSLFLGVLLAVQVVIWLLFTHVQSRFMVIAVPIIAILATRVGHTKWFVLCAGLAAGMIALSTCTLVAKFQRYLHADHEIAPLIGRENLQGLRLFDPTKAPPNQSIDLVGDACAFWYQIPMSRLHYKTVFDVDTSDPNKSIIEDWLNGMPGGIFVPDVDELRRFSKTYFGIPPPPPSAH